MHPTGTEGRLLVLSELSGVLIWRDYSGGSGISGCEAVQMPSGQMTTMFIRPGALALVALLLQEPCCDFAIVSGMEEKYCVPIAGRLLQRAYPAGEWALERGGAVTCWALTGYPDTRVYVIGQVLDKQGAECVMKDLDRVWATLHERGCGWYTEQNTVLLDTARHSSSRPDSVCLVRRWRPQAEGAEDPNPIDMELGRRLLATLDEGAGAAQHIGVARASFWGPYHWVTDLDDADYHMKALWMDLLESPIVGIEVKCHQDQVCVVQLASGRRGLVLDALALKDMMRGLLQPLLREDRVYKIFHGHCSDLQWIQ